mgnify:CR=1 FL=1
MGISSLEMTGEALVQKMLFQRGKADLQRWRTGYAVDGDVQLLTIAAGALAFHGLARLALARDELRRRFARLPAAEQEALHARAADALAELGLGHPESLSVWIRLGEHAAETVGHVEQAAPLLLVERHREAAEAVDGGRVDPVDADGHRLMDRADGKGVVLRAPAEFPIAAADGPGAQADGRELERRVAEFAGLHGEEGIEGRIED